MNIMTVGLDLAKDVLVVCAMDERGQIVDRHQFSWKRCAEWLQQLPRGCWVGMEACGAAHHWARKATSMGLVPKLMAAEFVCPFRKSRAGKNDANDAEAIAIAVRQPTMRFVTVKNEEQQAQLSWHRWREGWKEERVAIINRSRGLLLEFGLVVPQSPIKFKAHARNIVADDSICSSVRCWLNTAIKQINTLDEYIDEAEREINQAAKTDPKIKQLQTIVGVGPLIASAIRTTVGNALNFRNGRQFAAWLGLTPRQNSSGGKTQLGKITRRGDTYLRTILIQGSRSCLQAAQRKEALLRTREQRWIMQLLERIGWNKTLVAIANKHARQMWVMLARDEEYNPNAWQVNG